MTELPDGWSTAPLDHLIAKEGLFSDGDWVESKDQDPNGQIRLLQLADVGDGIFLNKSKRFINEEQFQRLRCTEVLESDVLIARMPDPIGRACLAPPLSQRCVTVVDIAIVRPGPRSVHAGWLMHTLNAPSVRSRIEMDASGTTRQRITRTKLASLELPIPPLEEQRRIAQELDKNFVHLRACRDRLDRVRGILIQLRHSILAAATSGRLALDRRAEGAAPRWESVSLGDVATNFDYGSSQKSAKSGSVPVLRMGNIQNGRLDWSDLVFTSDTSEIEKYRLQPGDVLFNRTNSPELVGKTAVFSGERDAIHAGYLIRVRCSKRLVPEYLNYCLNSPSGRDYCWRVKSDGVSQSNINATKLRDFTFSLPPVSEQQEIVRRTESLLDQAARLEIKLKATRSIIGTLAPALLTKAFRGQLVPQDPNDERASELLERIHATSADQSNPKPPKNAGALRPRGRRKATAMTKSRQDEDVKWKPYLAAILKTSGGRVDTEELFRRADLSLADFYKQLAWEVKSGHIHDDESKLKVP